MDSGYTDDVCQTRQLQLLVEGVTDYAIFMLDPQGNVVNWNPGAERLKGYTRREILGQHFSRSLPLLRRHDARTC